jgi:hypothetical protein
VTARRRLNQPAHTDTASTSGPKQGNITDYSSRNKTQLRARAAHPVEALLQYLDLTVCTVTEKLNAFKRSNPNKPGYFRLENRSVFANSIPWLDFH